MTDLTPESPAVKLYAALHDYEPTEIDTTQSLLGFFKGQNLDLLAAEHERIVAERLAPVVDERDAAIAERDRLRKAVEFYSERMTYTSRVGMDSPISRDNFGDRARAALNPRAAP